MTGEEWAQVVTGTLIWVVLPFLAGLWRVLRAEVK
jgi:ABC-2 type transport system permease protein